jgi:hypothetical protein
MGFGCAARRLAAGRPAGGSLDIGRKEDWFGGQAHARKKVVFGVGA